MKSLLLKDRENGLYNAVIESPRHSRNKYIYDKKSGLFKIKRTLPEGMTFPYDFGFLPETLSEDGDPIDIMVFMDEPGVVGCFVAVRLVGVIEAKQIVDGVLQRNDRLLGVSGHSLLYKNLRTIQDIGHEILSGIESFFELSARATGKSFTLTGNHGPQRADELVKQAHRNYVESLVRMSMRRA